jgi:pyruvate/2-oxoglutarate dehydrogenase complex dihydrolipoamide dehydrogenase (E3) component
MPSESIEHVRTTVVKPRPDGYDLVVIGAGSAGLSVAAAAAQLGVSVALIEADKMGGECLNIGCVPSKALLRCAHVAQTVRESATFGVRASPPTVDGAAVFDYVRSRIAALAPHDSAERFRSLGCDVLFGRARFIDAKSLELTSGDGSTASVRGRRFVIATGSSPRVPTIDGLTEAGFRTNDDLFGLRAVPRRLAVIGGGPIGVEMAQAFQNLGSQATIIQSGPRLLPRDDADLAERLAHVLRRQGVRILTDAKTLSVERSADGKRLRVSTADGVQEVAADEILVAAGRTPNTSLNLDAAGVGYDERGVTVNRKMQTSVKHIYACGDASGPYRFTHMAGYQAGVVVANAIFRWPRKTRDAAVPWCTFTDPELAHVGMSTADADAAEIECRTITVDLATVDRAVCDSTEGAVKMAVDRRGRLLGASILAPRAGEMIHEFAILLSSGAKLSTLRDTIHCYPSYGDAVKKAASELDRSRLFSERTRTVVRWIRRLLG